MKGRNFKLKCLIQSSEVSDITLELIKDGVSKETRDINLNKGYSFFEFEQKSDQLGNGVFELKLNSKKGADSYNTLSQHRVQIYQPKTALIIGEKFNPSLTNLIKDVGFNYEFLLPENISQNENFDSYSFVLLDNVRAKRINRKKFN